MSIDIYVLRSHYRSPLDFTGEGLASARSGMQRLTSFRSRLGDAGGGEPSAACGELTERTARDFSAAMDDDLNAPAALASIFDMVRAGNALLDEGAGAADRGAMASLLDGLAGDILGLDLSSGSSGADTEVLLEELARSREALRAARRFEEADRMRGRLEEAGYSVSDLPGGKSEIRPR